MTKQIIGAQGEITIIKIDSMPIDFATFSPVERSSKGWIISHSESGNHHILTGGDVKERVANVPEGMKMLYALLENPARLMQDAQAPHGYFDLDPGIYQFRVAREFDPFAEQARRVAD